MRDREDLHDADRRVLRELARRQGRDVRELAHEAVRLLAFRAGASWRRVLREMKNPGHESRGSTVRAPGSHPPLDGLPPSRAT